MVVNRTIYEEKKLNLGSFRCFTFIPKTGMQQSKPEVSDSCVFKKCYFYNYNHIILVSNLSK